MQGRKVIQGKLKLNPIHEEFDQAQEGESKFPIKSKFGNIYNRGIYRLLWNHGDFCEDGFPELTNCVLLFLSSSTFTVQYITLFCPFLSMS